MDSTRLHNNLIDAGERLVEAIHTEQQIHARCGTACDEKSWGRSFRIARRGVKFAAEQYAGALRSFRLATVAVFAVEADLPAIPRPASSHRRRRVCASCGLGSRAIRKELADEAFPLSSRRSKLQ